MQTKISVSPLLMLCIAMGMGEKDMCMLGMDVKEVIVKEWGKQKGLGGVTRKGGRGFKSNKKKDKEKKLHTVKIYYCIYCVVPL